MAYSISRRALLLSSTQGAERSIELSASPIRNAAKEVTGAAEAMAYFCQQLHSLKDGAMDPLVIELYDKAALRDEWHLAERWCLTIDPRYADEARDNAGGAATWDVDELVLLLQSLATKRASLPLFQQKKSDPSPLLRYK